MFSSSEPKLLCVDSLLGILAFRDFPQNKFLVSYTLSSCTSQRSSKFQATSQYQLLPFASVAPLLMAFCPFILTFSGRVGTPRTNINQCPWESASQWQLGLANRGQTLGSRSSSAIIQYRIPEPLDGLDSTAIHIVFSYYRGARDFQMILQSQ